MSEATKNLKNFNVLVPDTGASQLSYFVIKGVNSLCETNPEIDVILFYENHHKNCLPANFSTMQISDAWFQHGPTIATSFSTASKLASFPCERKIFYVWDLEWIRNERGTRQYEQYNNVYCNESIEIIARSEPHKLAIENAFNRRVNHVVSDFEPSKILEILQ
tara:strand:- start:3509 stop:3997 length:489 start_codon:yes stop_codon:yes gene_type:complete